MHAYEHAWMLLTCTHNIIAVVRSLLFVVFYEFLFFEE